MWPLSDVFLDWLYHRAAIFNGW